MSERTRDTGRLQEPAFDPIWDAPRTASDIYDRIESTMWAEGGYEAVEAHEDGVLLRTTDGREWWLTAEEQP